MEGKAIILSSTNGPENESTALNDTYLDVQKRPMTGRYDNESVALLNELRPHGNWTLT